MNENAVETNVETTQGLKVDPRLQFHGGVYASLIPFLIFIAGTVVLALMGYGTETGYWVATILALMVGMFLSKNKNDYFDAIVEGMTEKMTSVAVLCWVWAGAFAGLLKVSGMVEGLMWLGVKANLTGGMFVAFTFVLGAIYGTSLGSGWATITSLTLFMYPAGIALGADPVVLGGAIIAAGCFGDNLGPVSDTTILSATFMERDVAGVVKTRLPYTFIAAGISIVLFILIGGGDGSAVSPEVLAEILSTADPMGLLMAIPALVVILLALRGASLMYAITIGMIGVFVIGLPTGLLNLQDVFYLDPETGALGGAFVEGVAGFAYLILLVLLVTGISYIMQCSGALNILMNKLRGNVIKTARGAEVTMWSIMAVSAAVLSTSVVAIIAAAPLIKSLGDDFKINRYRMANFLDSVHCMCAYTLPWTGATLLFCRMTALAATTYDFVPVISNPLTCVPYAFHCYILAAVFLVSAITGIGRTYEK